MRLIQWHITLFSICYKRFKCMSFHLFAKNVTGTEFQKILNNFIYSKCTASKFSRNTLLSYIVVSQKFKLKLIIAKFLLPMISRNELFITLSTLWLFCLVRVRTILFNNILVLTKNIWCYVWINFIKIIIFFIEIN